MTCCPWQKHLQDEHALLYNTQGPPLGMAGASGSSSAPSSEPEASEGRHLKLLDPTPASQLPRCDSLRLALRASSVPCKTAPLSHGSGLFRSSKSGWRKGQNRLPVSSACLCDCRFSYLHEEFDPAVINKCRSLSNSTVE